MNKKCLTVDLILQKSTSKSEGYRTKIIKFEIGGKATRAN